MAPKKDDKKGGKGAEADSFSSYAPREPLPPPPAPAATDFPAPQQPKHVPQMFPAFSAEDMQGEVWLPDEVDNRFVDISFNRSLLPKSVASRVKGWKRAYDLPDLEKPFEPEPPLPEVEEETAKPADAKGKKAGKDDKKKDDKAAAKKGAPTSTKPVDEVFASVLQQLQAASDDRCCVLPRADWCCRYAGLGEDERDVEWAQWVASLYRMIANHPRFFAKGTFLYECLYPQDSRGLPLVNPNGRYLMRLFIHSAWRVVEFDDVIPLDHAGVPLLPKADNPRHLWPLLLTKGLLKAFQPELAAGVQQLPIVEALTGWLPHRTTLSWSSLERCVHRNVMVSLSLKSDAAAANARRRPTTSPSPAAQEDGSVSSTAKPKKRASKRKAAEEAKEAKRPDTGVREAPALPETIVCAWQSYLLCEMADEPRQVRVKCGSMRPLGSLRRRRRLDSEYSVEDDHTPKTFPNDTQGAFDPLLAGQQQLSQRVLLSPSPSPPPLPPPPGPKTTDDGQEAPPTQQEIDDRMNDFYGELAKKWQPASDRPLPIPPDGVTYDGGCWVLWEDLLSLAGTSMVQYFLPQDYFHVAHFDGAWERRDEPFKLPVPHVCVLTLAPPPPPPEPPRGKGNRMARTGTRSRVEARRSSTGASMPPETTRPPVDEIPRLPTIFQFTPLLPLPPRTAAPPAPQQPPEGADQQQDQEQQQQQPASPRPPPPPSPPLLDEGEDAESFFFAAHTQTGELPPSCVIQGVTALLGDDKDTDHPTVALHHAHKMMQRSRTTTAATPKASQSHVGSSSGGGVSSGGSAVWEQVDGAGGCWLRGAGGDTAAMRLPFGKHLFLISMEAWTGGGRLRVAAPKVGMGEATGAQIMPLSEYLSASGHLQTVSESGSIPSPSNRYAIWSKLVLSLPESPPRDLLLSLQLPPSPPVIHPHLSLSIAPLPAPKQTTEREAPNATAASPPAPAAPASPGPPVYQQPIDPPSPLPSEFVSLPPLPLTHIPPSMIVAPSRQLLILLEGNLRELCQPAPFAAAVVGKGGCARQSEAAGEGREGEAANNNQLDLKAVSLPFDTTWEGEMRSSEHNRVLRERLTVTGDNATTATLRLTTQFPDERDTYLLLSILIPRPAPTLAPPRAPPCKEEQKTEGETAAPPPGPPPPPPAAAIEKPGEVAPGGGVSVPPLLPVCEEVLREEGRREVCIRHISLLPKVPYILECVVDPFRGSTDLTGGRWRMQLIATDTLELGRDTTQDDVERAVRSSWASAKPERPTQAKETRHKYLVARQAETTATAADATGGEEGQKERLPDPPAPTLAEFREMLVWRLQLTEREAFDALTGVGAEADQPPLTKEAFTNHPLLRQRLKLTSSQCAAVFDLLDPQATSGITRQHFITSLTPPPSPAIKALIDAQAAAAAAGGAGKDAKKAPPPKDQGKKGKEGADKGDEKGTTEAVAPSGLKRPMRDQDYVSAALCAFVRDAVRSEEDRLVTVEGTSRLLDLRDDMLLRSHELTQWLQQEKASREQTVAERQQLFDSVKELTERCRLSRSKDPGPPLTFAPQRQNLQKRVFDRRGRLTKLKETIEEGQLVLDTLEPLMKEAQESEGHYFDKALMEVAERRLRILQITHRCGELVDSAAKTAAENEALKEQAQRDAGAQGEEGIPQPPQPRPLLDQEETRELRSLNKEIDALLDTEGITVAIEGAGGEGGEATAAAGAAAAAGACKWRLSEEQLVVLRKARELAMSKKQKRATQPVVAA
ncbi:unnamed protein product [Vitrella brassicaformis CCMP3155]|uniref:Calpain catalytic domain-containing protein n=2 Tax=Vitrella brassicaformis TaxID=1169539 RepID=A0A0G4FKV4_VITBC|nr:unnamed protein product [Vitrella brassicaformis CCMP3155]|eukprot:CEM14591.1 unnamed protein product [Vitrella brassicaformis CCMP3155]